MKELITSLLVTVILISTLFMFIASRLDVNYQESYQAWIKQTGNPKDLTFDEFLALSRTGFFVPK